MIDGAVSAKTLRAINRDWPPDEDGNWRKEDGTFQRKWAMPANDGAPLAIVRALSAPAFCEQLAELLGVDELESDPAQYGGGLHAIPPGGYLQMHTDFRYHPNGRRRVANLLLYVNQTWEPGWGGELCLGDRKHLPLGGRAVVFRTDQKDSWHGHPDPLRCPEGVMRRSLAVYYYGRKVGVPDTTVYKK